MLKFSYIRFRWNLQQMRSEGNAWVRAIVYAIAFTIDEITLDPFLLIDYELEDS